MNDYPKARAEARKFAQCLVQTMRQSSLPAEQAIVSDVSTQVTAGFVTATTLHGPIRVFGIAPYTVIPGMRVMVRRMSHGGLTDYVVESTLAGMSMRGVSSGGIAVTDGLNPAADSAAITTPGVVSGSGNFITIPASPPSTGWFVSFFIYLSALPSRSAPAVLFDLGKVDGSYNIASGFRVTYNYLGQLGCYFYTTGSSPTIGTYSSHAFSPHRIWFVTMQLGEGLLVDGANPGSSPSNLTPGSSFTAGNYGVFLLSDSFGANAPNPGSWLSKVTFGCNYNSGPIRPYASGFIPGQDSDIVNGSAALSSGLTVYGRWMCSDGSGTSLPDTSAANGTTSLSINGVQLNYGPY